MKIGIIGAGKMAGAMVRGWVSKGLVPASQVPIKYQSNQIFSSD